MTALESGFDNKNYFNGDYFGGNFGPVSDFNKVETYTLANLSGDVDPYKTATDTWPNIFHTIERIPAFYAMNTIDFGKLHLQTGLRFEETQMDTFGYNLQFITRSSPTAPCSTTSTNHCWNVNGVSNNPSYLDVLPSVQLRYGIDANSNLRAVIARGVARPDPYQLVPYVTRTISAVQSRSLLGNPCLRPEHANNYDLLYETLSASAGHDPGGILLQAVDGAPWFPPSSLAINVANLPAGSVPARSSGHQSNPTRARIADSISSRNSSTARTHTFTALKPATSSI